MQDRQPVAMTRTENFHSKKALEFGERPGVDSDDLEIKAEVESSRNHVTWVFELGSCQW